MTPAEASFKMHSLCSQAPVVPVLVIDDLAHAVPLARALIAGGLSVLEVTLRTPVALAAIAAMATVPGATVGAGTLITASDVSAAKAAGADFGVSPGATPVLLDACEAADLPLLPGAASITEVMTLLARGYSVQKFFPAEANGGVAALSAISGPLPQVQFCPTGGVNTHNAPEYLALKNVICVGGSWVAPSALLARGDWQGITALARAAIRLQS